MANDFAYLVNRINATPEGNMFRFNMNVLPWPFILQWASFFGTQVPRGLGYVDSPLEPASGDPEQGVFLWANNPEQVSTGSQVFLWKKLVASGERRFSFNVVDNRSTGNLRYLVLIG